MDLSSHVEGIMHRQVVRTRLYHPPVGGSVPVSPSPPWSCIACFDDSQIAWDLGQDRVVKKLHDVIKAKLHGTMFQPNGLH